MTQMSWMEEFGFEEGSGIWISNDLQMICNLNDFVTANLKSSPPNHSIQMRIRDPPTRPGTIFESEGFEIHCKVNSSQTTSLNLLS